MYLGHDHEACTYCPFRESGTPIQDRIAVDPRLAILGEAPGLDDMRQGVVLSGRVGKFIEAWSKASGYGVEKAYCTNLVRCNIPNGAKITADTYRYAATCCKQLLIDNMRELGITVVLCLGNEPWYALTGIKSAVNFRGSFLSGEDFSLPVRYLTATMHPAAVLAKEELTPWLDLMRADLVHAGQVAEGEIDLYEPNVLDAGFNHGEDVLRLLIHAKENNEVVAVDVETTGTNARTCGLVTVGFATSIGAISVPWGKDFREVFGINADPILAMTLDLFSDPTRELVFHNKAFDVPVLERVFDVEIKAIRHDTLLMHHVLYAKAPHDLQNVTTQFLPTEPWKQLFHSEAIPWEAFEEGEDDDPGQMSFKVLLAPSRMERSHLYWYNAADAAATLEVFKRMRQELATEGLAKLYDVDRRLVDVSLDWTRTGIEVSESVRSVLESSYQNELDDLRERLQELSKVANFNPDSPKQLLQALMNNGIVPRHTTAKGNISTAKGALLDFRGRPLIDTLFTYREKSKLHSTFIVGLPSKVCEDGRLHPSWNLTASPSGRFGTHPAVQNWPKSMKKMLVAPDGFVIIGADFAALELRLIALLSGEVSLIEAFNDGADIHAFLAGERYFPNIWKDATPERRKELRSRGKNVTFGDNYLAGPETLFDQIRDKDPTATLTEVRRMQAVLRATYPNKLKLAEWCQKYARENRNLPTPFLGRQRRWQLRMPDATITINHFIQGAASDQANLAVLRWADDLRARGVYRESVWPNLQIHDAFYAYCEEARAEDEAARLGALMGCEVTYTSPVTRKTHTIKLTAEAQIGRSYGDF